MTGALVGMLATTSVLVSTKTLSKPKCLGASTTFVRAAGVIEKTVAKDHVENNPYDQANLLKVLAFCDIQIESELSVSILLREI